MNKHKAFICSGLLLIYGLSYPITHASKHYPPGSKFKILEVRKGSLRAKLYGLKSRIPFDDPSGWWGVIDATPVIVFRLEIFCDGESIMVPRSCFSDLANVNCLKILSRKYGQVIFMEGADGGEDYICKITVKKKTVVSRTVYSGEDFDREIETTTFRFIESKDD